MNVEYIVKQIFKYKNKPKKQKCELCGQVLRRFRVHSDWESRTMHTKCLRVMLDLNLQRFRNDLNLQI